CRVHGIGGFCAGGDGRERVGGSEPGDRLWDGADRRGAGRRGDLYVAVRPQLPAQYCRRQWRGGRPVIYDTSWTAIGVFAFFVAVVLGISFYLGSKAKSASG